MSGRRWSGPAWVGLTIVGYAAGMGVSGILYRLASPALSAVAAGALSTALYGAVSAGLGGVLQALLLRPGVARTREWAIAAALGGAAGFVLGSAAAEIASNAIGLQLDVYLAGAIIQIVFGALAGVGIGLAQWLLIRGRVAHSGAWVVASVVGLTLGFSIPIGIMQLVDLPVLPVMFGLAGGLFLGLTQWLWGRRIAW